MGAPAGWYDDPQDQQLIRYFDGESWTTQTAPRPGASQPSSPAAQPSSPAAAHDSRPAWVQGTQQAAQGQQPGAQKTPSWQAGAQQQGQQPAQSQPSWQAQQAQQSQARPPQQPQSPTAGFQFGGAQQVPTADAAPSQGTPKSVKIGILAAFLACLAIFALGYAMTDRESGDGLSASELGISGLGCPELVDEYVGLSASDPDDQRLVSASGGSEDRSAVGDVKAPTGNGQNFVFSCEYPTAEWADGSQSGLSLEVRVDKNLDLYIGAAKR